MLENKNLLLGLILFLGGTLGSGLFAIAQAVCDIANKLGSTAQNICGILCFIFLAFWIVGIVLIVKELVLNKHSK